MIPDSHFSRFACPKYRARNPVQRWLIRRFGERLYGLFLDANPASRVLEVGCGEGFLSGYLAERFPDKRFLGLDIEPSKLEALRKLFPRVEAVAGSAYDLSCVAERGPFDLIICAEVLEHLEEPRRALDQFAALRAGHVLFTVPHEPWFRLSNLLRGKNLARFGDDVEHVQHWTRASFRRLLLPHFEVVRERASFPWLLFLGKPR